MKTQEQILKLIDKRLEFLIVQTTRLEQLSTAKMQSFELAAMQRRYAEYDAGIRELTALKDDILKDGVE